MLVFLIFSTSFTNFGLRPNLGCGSEKKAKILFFALLFARLALTLDFVPS